LTSNIFPANSPDSLVPDPTSQTPDTQYSRSDRVRHKPSYLSDYVCTSSDSSPKLTSSGTPYPISSFHYLSQLSASHSVFTLSLTQDTETKSYIEACKSEHWVKAMNSELDALTKTGTIR
jgi:hypothetical protein